MKSVAMLALVASTLPVLGQAQAGGFHEADAPLVLASATHAGSAGAGPCMPNTHVPLPDDMDNKYSSLFGQRCGDSIAIAALVVPDDLPGPLDFRWANARPMLKAAFTPQPFGEEWDRLPTALHAVLPKAVWEEADLLPVAFLPPGAEILTMADALDRHSSEADSFHSRPYAFVPPPVGEERDILAAPQEAPVATSTTSPSLTLPVVEVGLTR